TPKSPIPPDGHVIPDGGGAATIPVAPRPQSARTAPIPRTLDEGEDVRPAAPTASKPNRPAASESDEVEEPFSPRDVSRPAPMPEPATAPQSFLPGRAPLTTESKVIPASRIGETSDEKLDRLKRDAELLRKVHAFMENRVAVALKTFNELEVPK